MVKGVLLETMDGAHYTIKRPGLPDVVVSREPSESIFFPGKVVSLDAALAMGRLWHPELLWQASEAVR